MLNTQTDKQTKNGKSNLLGRGSNQSYMVRMNLIFWVCLILVEIRQCYVHDNPQCVSRQKRHDQMAVDAIPYTH